MMRSSFKRSHLGSRLRIRAVCQIAHAYSKYGRRSSSDPGAIFPSLLFPKTLGPAPRYATPTDPKLAGQSREYLANQVKDIRDGRRTNGQAAVMKAIVASLTDAEIDAIARYLAAVD